MSVRVPWIALCVAGLASAACSSSDDVGDHGSGGAGGAFGQAGSAGTSRGGSSSTAAGASGGTMPAATYGGGCPDRLPDAGPCSDAGRACTYGDASRIECRDSATCTSGQWVIVRSPCEPPADPATCPAEVPLMRDCEDEGRYCRYEDGTECQCVTAFLHTWICDLPRQSADPLCPPLAPNAGTTCEASLAGNALPTCGYFCGDLSGVRAQATCEDDGVWAVTTSPCAQTNSQ